ncbi:hypothetical protein [Methylocystis sp. ATCC 49242]|uniref:hypothetical protein n=1 Tax=Methylocystis sp. ATCC 49242 TaxID=622637 RepID=UPI0001F88049|nr:hypothetical protein [Methylocystis sp. ATCC 49242]
MTKNPAHPIFVAALALCATPATATEIHLDCARSNQTAMVDIDTDRNFLQIMWGEGVAEEYKDGDSYISGPDKYGRKEKVVYVMNMVKSVVTFGSDRLCMEDGAKKCADQHVRNTLDVNRGEMKYDNGDEIAVLTCNPAPPGRRF